MVWPDLKPALVLNGQALSEHCELERELRAAGVEIVFRGIDDIAIDIGPQGVRVQETVDGRDLGDFGVVQALAYPRPSAMLLNAVADYAVAKGVRTVNITGIGAPTKLFKYVRLANH